MGTVLTQMVSTPFRWIKDWLTRPWRGSQRRITNTPSQLEPWHPMLFTCDPLPSTRWRRTSTPSSSKTQHVDSVDVIGVLEETHTPGRYRLRSWQPLLRLNYTHLREIDVYFTDPAGAVIGAAVASDPTTANDITTHGSIFMFLDFEDSTKITTDPLSGELTEHCDERF